MKLLKKILLDLLALFVFVSIIIIVGILLLPLAN